MSKKSESNDSLTPQQELFCQEYMKDRNGTRAAIRAGYTENEPAAAVQASKLLRNAKVAGRVQELIDGMSRRIQVTADEVILELKRIGLADFSKAFDQETGKVLPFKDIPEEVRRAMAGVEVFEEWQFGDDGKQLSGHTKKVKFWDKLKALELLGKHLELFTDKVKITGNAGLADRLVKARARRGNK